MHLLPSKLKRALALASCAALTTVGIGLSTHPAEAATVPGMYIDVNGYGAGTGLIDGATGSVTSVLTATGGGTCTLANGTATIASFDTGTTTTATRGAVCHLYDATADYTLTFTNLVGVSQTFYRTCVWVLGSQTCSVRGINKI
jgi:hypothetical protein